MAQRVVIRIGDTRYMHLALRRQRVSNSFCLESVADRCLTLLKLDELGGFYRYNFIYTAKTHSGATGVRWMRPETERRTFCTGTPSDTLL